jgi:fructuronate reductase
LNRETAQALPADVIRPAYPVAEQKCGIVHLGIGAFHRAHQTVYTDKAMAQGDRDWRICGVSLRTGHVRDQLQPQDGLYTVTEKGRGEPKTTLIGAVARVLVAPESPAAVISSLASQDTKIVTLTVTEKGYCQAADGSLDETHEAVAAELAGGDPAGIYGFLAEGLARRRSAGLGGLTLLSCDNLSANGTRLRSLLTSFLERTDPDLADWCADHCTFPSSMVDRIVPATTEDDVARLAERLGVRDEGAVFTETFSQWVIEDAFAGARPRWNEVGAQLVQDVHPYETAKLRMLNGAHSALAYLGLECGLTYVHEAMESDAIRQLVDLLMRNEAASSLSPAPGQDLDAYADTLMDRFENPALEHRLAQIAMDGSQKIPQRWLATLSHHQQQARDCPALLEALAAWIVHVRGESRMVEDPIAAKLARLWAQQGQGGIVSALVGREGLFSASYVADERAQSCLRQYIATRLSNAGARD